ncbi:unnamed protein product [Rotaria socialis]|uniref:Di-N-acetylchitobiase n=1 Tax=Rotaria socialis TaxID=392032 RepID=A0A819WXX1_9BILA|nr:unnamed protein product [Rotaria socialis]CAF3359427.1 unnamed protein product [Rotaria socialis]CAF3365704.1 unnamed protein product [Rotaria socialis]CAF3474812.1 unnamed protein product [Rotaria socialis]CAF4132183.1 unnamed protein product [Rotaria socialis]
MLNLVIIFIVVTCINSARSECPCPDISLCAPLQTGPRHEKVAFMVSDSNWRSYDYSQLTTIVICTNDIDPQLLCLAHSRQVRLVWIANYDVKQLSNATARTEWVNRQVDNVKRTYTDGVNLDMEDEIPYTSDAAHKYTELVQELSNLIHVQVPGSMVSVDVAWSAPCIDGRCYDYAGLARASDFLFVMAYDLRSQIYDLNDCVASANSPIVQVAAGLTNFTQIFQIPPSKLVLGVPWYCYDYKCLSFDSNMTCTIEHVPFRGAPCSDAAGVQRDYQYCRVLLRMNSTSGRLIDNRTGAVFFNYVNQQDTYVHQVWMDDPETLTIKYNLANDRRLLGIGMWNVDCLDYASSASKEAQQDTTDMWNAMKIFHSVHRKT